MLLYKSTYLGISMVPPKEINEALRRCLAITLKNYLKNSVSIFWKIKGLILVVLHLVLDLIEWSHLTYQVKDHSSLSF